MLSKAGMEIFLQEMVAQQPNGTINYQDVNFLKLTTGQQTSHMVRKFFAKRIKSLEKTNGDNVVCETIRKINGFLGNPFIEGLFHAHVFSVPQKNKIK